MFDIHTLKKSFYLMAFCKTRQFTSIINSISPFCVIIFYLLFFFTILFFYTKQTQGNLSLLIHINEKYIQLNPKLKFPSMIILKNEGYDGQFFYFLSRYLYDSEINSITVDSSFFRLLRVGASLLYGVLPSLFGWKYYAFLGILINIFIFLISFWLLYRILNNHNKYIAFLYLFNPFSLISNMLLIGDNFFISFFIFFLYFYLRATSELDTYKQNLYYFFTFLVSVFLVLTKETANFYFFPLVLYSLIHKKKKETLVFFFPIMVSFLWIYVLNQYFKLQEVSSSTHLERIRFPFVDMFYFYITLLQNIKSIVDIFKSIPYFLLLIMLLSLGLQILNFIRLFTNFKLFFSIKIFEFLFYFPIAMSLFSILIVDYEYWLAFDNIFRIFVFAYLWNLYLICSPKFKQFNNYYFFLFLFFITLLLIPRYYFKKIGDFIIL